MDNIKSKEEKVFGVLFSKYSEKVNYIVFSSNMDVDAKNMIAKINKILKGKGGGKKELASGSASLKDFDKKLIESIREKILE
ncbi:TPA: hypothetical protein DCG82_07535 [candidate division WOR-3]|nr:hypothetical protein [candidate division WOR-3 bacterium]